jgi:hypothetical protein
MPGGQRVDGIGHTRARGGIENTCQEAKGHKVSEGGWRKTQMPGVQQAREK